MMKIVVISNMYPSTKNPSFGTFVKIFVEGLLEKGVKIELLIKRKNSVGSIINLFTYLIFYIRIFLKIHLDTTSYFYVHYANHSLVPFIFSNKRCVSTK